MFKIVASSSQKATVLLQRTWNVAHMLYGPLLLGAVVAIVRESDL